jgi:hypothetical protein
MRMCHSTLVRHGVDLCQSFGGRGCQAPRGAVRPLDLVTSVALGSLRELCRSRVAGGRSDARRSFSASNSALFFGALHEGGMSP